MKITARAVALFVVSGLGALVVGYTVGARAMRATAEESVTSLSTAQAALDTTRFTMLLQALREGKADLAADRMETMLDFAILDLARDYSPARDPEQSATKALRAAAAYRATHPYQNSQDSVAVRVREALARATPTSP